LDEDDIQHLLRSSGPFNKKESSQFLAKATDRDCLIFNVGHHADPGRLGMEKTWRQNHAHAMNEFLSSSYAPIPDQHVFFRTTAIGHFHAKSGDWNTKFRTGATQPNMKALWREHGGSHPSSQPEQNLMGTEMVSKHSNCQILDISPLMLSRADATADGSHFCIPGPVEFWGQMLFHCILQEEEESSHARTQ
jgi:hypothetical protein